MSIWFSKMCTQFSKLSRQYSKMCLGFTKLCAWFRNLSARFSKMCTFSWKVFFFVVQFAVLLVEDVGLSWVISKPRPTCISLVTMTMKWKKKYVFFFIYCMLVSQWKWLRTIPYQKEAYSKHNAAIRKICI